MYPHKEEPRHFEAGCFTCPVTHKEVHLESDVPRPWVHWPMRVRCSACNQEHVIAYEDVHHVEPAFGRE